jgi:hypothetical protein
MSEVSRKDSRPRDVQTRYSSCFFSDTLNKCRNSVFKHYNTIPTPHCVSFLKHVIHAEFCGDKTFIWYGISMVPKICFDQVPQCVSNFEKQAGFSCQTIFFYYRHNLQSCHVSKWDTSLECAFLLADENWVAGGALAWWLSIITCEPPMVLVRLLDILYWRQSFHLQWFFNVRACKM